MQKTKHVGDITVKLSLKKEYSEYTQSEAYTVNALVEAPFATIDRVQLYAFDIDDFSEDEAQDLLESIAGLLNSIGQYITEV